MKLKYNSINQHYRIIYLIAVVIVAILGLASRKYGDLLPSFVAENAGDTLWAMVVYFGLRFLFVGKSIHTAVLLSFLFSFGIELSQIYQADWINQLRSTLLGALILGKGFLYVDLIRYTMGILIATSLDQFSVSR